MQYPVWCNLQQRLLSSASGESESCFHFLAGFFYLLQIKKMFLAIFQDFINSLNAFFLIGPPPFSKAYLVLRGGYDFFCILYRSGASSNSSFFSPSFSLSEAVVCVEEK